MHRNITGLALAIGLAATSVVTASAQQYGGYNNSPSGSYQQSCNNVQMRGSTLSASCASPNGQRVYSSLNVNGCNGDIANVNGYLRCNGSSGYNNGGYNNNGNGNGYGRGRDNDDNNDNDDNQGHHHHRHYGNGNGNGYGNGRYNGGTGSGYGNGYGYGLPGGSYQQSCNNARMSGSTLSASCTAANGQWINSSINVTRCRNDIANRNGYLSC